MADSGNNGKSGRGDRPRERFIVEGGKIFNRAAAARQNDHVNTLRAIEVTNTRRDLSRRSLALHLRRIDQDANAFMPPVKDIQHVMQRGASRRGNNPNLARQQWNRFLARLVE